MLNTITIIKRADISRSAELLRVQRPDGKQAVLVWDWSRGQVTAKASPYQRALGYSATMASGLSDGSVEYVADWCSATTARRRWNQEMEGVCDYNSLYTEE